MFGLPKSTEFNKRIPKQKFYEKLTINSSIRKSFVEQIRIIYWRNKLDKYTLNIDGGRLVSEIEIFELQLNTPEVDEEILRFLDCNLHYHIIFLLEYNGRYQAIVGYKTANNSRKTKFKVEQYYRTKWLSEENLTLRLEGLTIDAVYENLVRYIAGRKLVGGANITLAESIEQDKLRAQLEKQLSVLEIKMKKEKQLNRKVELNTEIKKLKMRLGLC